MTNIDSKQEKLAALLALAPVVPVVVVEAARDAVPLARALVAGGIPAIEVTLRSAAALDAIRAIATDVEGAEVGVGTVLTPRQLEDAQRAGARFAVSPGCTQALLAAADALDIPYLPAAATPSEAMLLLERGHRHLKFFPAESLGGTATLRAWAGPLPQLSFCATGGIGARNARDYLTLPNVAAVGGSWLTPADAVRTGDWVKIETLARAAAALRG